MSGISLITKGFICPTSNIIKRIVPINTTLNTKFVQINSKLSNKKVNLDINDTNINIKQKNLKLLNINTPDTNVSLEINND